MLKSLTASIQSSKLFSQEKFNETSDKHVSATHYKHMVHAVFFVAICGVALMAVAAPRSRIAELLMDKGVTTTAIIDRIDVKKLVASKGEKFVTTINYHFRVADKTFSGMSTKHSVRSESLSPGGMIEVLYDPYQPDVNGWRSALIREGAGVFAVLSVAALLLPYLALSLFRYVQWIRRRRKLRLA